MFSLTQTELLITALVLVVSVAICQPKTCAFPRHGLDPGFGNLRVWPARIYFFFKGHDVVEKAYREAKDSPYLLQTLIEDVLVLPPKYLPELRMLPGTKLSASDALVVSVLGQYSGVDVILKDRHAYDVTRVQLTKGLPSLLPALSTKVDQVLSESLAGCSTSDYTEVKIQDVISNVVLRTTLLAFAGPGLADNDELHQLSDTHTKLVRDIAIWLLFVPSFLRGFISPLLPPSIRMRRLHPRVREILFSKSAVADRKEQPFKTLLQYLVETSDVVDEADIVAKFLVVVGAAVRKKIVPFPRKHGKMNISQLHTMTMSTVHAIIDLCAHPTCIPTLRAEISQHLVPSPPWTLDTINRLKTLDAFFKESQRFNPPNYLSFDRLALAPIPLSSGAIIPKGTYICMDAADMAMDPAFYASPVTFSPKRFSAPEQDGRLTNGEFVATEGGNVHWGSGRFTCPGRWYASAVIKVIVAFVVGRYEVGFPEGQSERLPNVYMDILVEPDPRQGVRFRWREMGCKG